MPLFPKSIWTVHLFGGVVRECSLLDIFPLHIWVLFDKKRNPDSYMQECSHKSRSRFSGAVSAALSCELRSG